MIEHIKLFSFPVLLFLGSWFLFYLKEINRLYPYSFIKAIINYALAVIVIICLQFTVMYIRTNINSDELLRYSNCLQFVAYIGIIYTYYLMVNILVSFRDKPFSKSQNKLTILILSIPIVGYIFKTIFPGFQSLFDWVDLINDNELLLNDIAVCAELLILIGFYFFWINTNVNSDRKRISRSFTLLYIIFDCSTMLSVKMTDYYQINSSYKWLIFIIINSLILAIPLIWIKITFLEYAQKLLNPIIGNDKFKPLFDKYKITKREKEVIELLVDGKSSDEIKEDLFLSYHTVKNHISHIYEKLKVRNRTELILFFVKENMGEESS